MRCGVWFNREIYIARCVYEIECSSFYIYYISFAICLQHDEERERENRERSLVGDYMVSNLLAMRTTLIKKEETERGGVVRQSQPLRGVATRNNHTQNRYIYMSSV